MRTGRVPGLPRAILRIAWSQWLPDVPLPLADTACLMRVETEAGQINPGHRNAYNVLAFAADELALSDVLLQFLLDLASNDLFEATMVLFDFRDHNYLRASFFTSPRAKILA